MADCSQIKSLLTDGSRCKAVVENLRVSSRLVAVIRSRSSERSLQPKAADFVRFVCALSLQFEEAPLVQLPDFNAFSVTSWGDQQQVNPLCRASNFRIDVLKFGLASHVCLKGGQ